MESKPIQKLPKHCRQTNALKALGFTHIILGGYGRRIYALHQDDIYLLKNYIKKGGITLSIGVFPQQFINALQNNTIYKI